MRAMGGIHIMGLMQALLGTTSRNHKYAFEWFVVRCGSKNRHPRIKIRSLGEAGVNRVYVCKTSVATP